MNTWKKKPVTVVIADAGPLISLACADELSLLQSFGRPVLVTDVVHAECTRKVGAPGEERLSHWFDVGGGNQFKEVKTPFLGEFQKAVQQEISGEDPEASRGMGDATITWLIKNVDRVKTTDGVRMNFLPNEIILVLTEDGTYGDVVLRGHRVHVLSTRQWLHALQELDIIDSANDVISEIQAGRRRVSKYKADRPTSLGNGYRSDWRDETERTAEDLQNGSVCETCNAVPCICGGGGPGGP